MPKRRIPKKRVYQRDSKGRFKKTHGTDISRSRHTGKQMVLFHRTTSYRAKNIAATRNWKTGPFQDGFVNLSSGGPTHEEHVKGNAVLQVLVPRKNVHREFQPYKHVGYFIVDRKALQGKKVRRLKAKYKRPSKIEYP